MKSLTATATFLACELTTSLLPAGELVTPARLMMGYPRGGPGTMEYPGAPVMMLDIKEASA
jgi:hypothetical protein